MPDFIQDLPRQLIYLGASVLLAAIAAGIHELLERNLRRILPLQIGLDETRRIEELQRTYQAEMTHLGGMESLISGLSLVTLPILNYQLMKLVLRLNAQPNDHLLFAGGGALLFFSAIGGAVLGPFLTRRYIRLRYRGSAEIEWLYARSDDRYGAIGRIVIRNSGILALCLIFLPAAYLANSYTLVGEHRIEIRHPENRFQRLVLPNEEIASIEAEQVGKQRLFSVRYRDGRVLTSRATMDSYGDLDALAAGPRKAIEFLAAATGISITEPAP